MPNVDESFFVGISLSVKVGMKREELRINPLEKRMYAATLTSVLVDLLDGNSVNRRHRNP